MDAWGISIKWRTFGELNSKRSFNHVEEASMRPKEFRLGWRSSRKAASYLGEFDQARGVQGSQSSDKTRLVKLELG